MGTIKLSRAVMLATIAGSLCIALPAQARHEDAGGAVVIAKRDYGDYGNHRDERRADDRRRTDNRQSLRRNEGDSSRYGYGYERRQRNAESGGNGDDADQQRRNRREERREDRREERRNGWR